MKIFISSLISGMERERTLAKKIIKRLGNDFVSAEDFPAQTNSPQVACLQGLRQSGLVVLILNETYGEIQASGLSATHEEYREARDTRPIIAFIKQASNREASQQEFINEVSNWSNGLFRSSYNSLDDFEDQLTKALHSWEVNQASAPVDEASLITGSLDALSNNVKSNSHSHSTGESDLLISVISGPSIPILRPSQIEEESFVDKLLQAALFGPYKIFDKGSGSESYIDGENLYIKQNDGENFIMLDPKGGLTFGVSLRNKSASDHWGGIVIIKEQLLDKMEKVLRYAAFVLDSIDNTQRLTHFCLAVQLTHGGSIVTQAESEAQRQSNIINLGNSYGHKKNAIHLTPAVRHRSALVHDIDAICADLTTLLKRSLQRNR